MTLIGMLSPAVPTRLDDGAGLGDHSAVYTPTGDFQTYSDTVVPTPPPQPQQQQPPRPPLPTAPGGRSLNVAQCAAVIAFEALRQQRSAG